MWIHWKENKETDKTLANWWRERTDTILRMEKEINTTAITGLNSYKQFINKFKNKYNRQISENINL